VSGERPDAWSPLLALPRHGTGVALPRLAEICAPLLEDASGDGPLTLRVAGSNGKGSVATFAAGILSALGLRTGLHTSPHLLDPGERLAVDGRPAAAEEILPSINWFLARRAAYLRDHPGEETGSFEALTAVALHHFRAARVDAAVHEAGLGGRLDPTRLARGPAVALTSLDLEHTALLGDSLEAIADEKAALCPDGGVLVVGLVPEALETHLEAHCRARRITPLVVEKLATIEGLRPRADGHPGSTFDVTWKRGGDSSDLPLRPTLRSQEIRLPGPHQPWNAAVATTLVTAALHRAGMQPSPDELATAIRTGLARATIPARFERLRRQPDLYTDIAHTPAAARTAAATAAQLRQRPETPLVLVLGVSEAKKVEEIVRELTQPLDPETDTVLATRSRWHGAPVDRVKKAVQVTGWTGRVGTFEHAEDAVPTAIEQAGATGLVLVAGSLYLAAEATCVVNDRDPAELRFF
jgi:dihydrofolate synthase / folylpolyglutamate synthase